MSLELCLDSFGAARSQAVGEETNEKGGRPLLVFIPTMRAGTTCGGILPRRHLVPLAWRVKTRNWSAERAGSRPKQWTGSMQFLLIEQQHTIHDKQIWETEFRFPSTICTQSPLLVNMGINHECGLSRRDAV